MQILHYIYVDMVQKYNLALSDWFIQIVIENQFTSNIIYDNCEHKSYRFTEM